MRLDRGLSVAPSGLDHFGWVDPGLAKLRPGLNSDRCSAALFRDHVWREILIERSSIAPSGLDHFAWVTQGSQSLALCLTLIAAPQLCFVITSNDET